MPVLIYISARDEVRGLQEVQTDLFLNRKLMTEKMPQKLVDFGSVGAIIALPESLSDGMLDAIRYYIREHILWDGVGMCHNFPMGFSGDLGDQHLGEKGRSMGWTWHHAEELGVMQPVPRDQHTAWDTIHPTGRGGFAIWGADF